MANTIKDQSEILKKMGIAKLNPMQEEACNIISSTSNVVLLSPTGTGKTLAFLLPIIEMLDMNSPEVQALILVPSRELAIQIEQVIREMGTGYKTNAVYGGRPFSKDKIELKHEPAILIGTPGRVSDHLRRETFSVEGIKTLVLDEFDKSLEVGFEEQMTEIIQALPNIEKRILTSATQQIVIPRFVGLEDPAHINYLNGKKESQLQIKTINSNSKDKLESLKEVLDHIGNKPGIVFCNFRDSIQRVSDFLHQNQISHGCFHGGMEQQDRERSLIKFRNGTHNIIVATDLAARGLDIPELNFIIHYQLPLKEEEFTHRNGRTARMNASGNAYVIKWVKEDLPSFIKMDELKDLKSRETPKNTLWETIFVSGGRKDKISKGDIAGLFFKQGKLEKDELGAIELKQDCCFVSVPAKKVQSLIASLNNTKLKNKKVRVRLI
ncbi:superfamily II DNA/RNA helicase [Gillisia mitskevichiae]|uniref:Superfamily II DNA/RNA helicase n=1 Tax=Gillisia mitskevichiae TaxID=270921 RepID=A0A495PQX7_9FLAO|nr:DEAD/DEAH box helicase [Gillisia mitskevichiae]RKS53044.1 superfamily II DNA/RNA helicase [Gillisia mitskevichiae]